MTRIAARELAKWAGGSIVLLVLPVIASHTSWLSTIVLGQGLVLGLASVGLAFLLKHTKQVSFGHAAFFGGGAYTTALLAEYLHVSSITVMIVVSLLVVAVLSAIIGYLSVGHRELYFGLLTLAFGMLLYALVLGNQSIFNGSNGLPVRPKPVGQPTLFGMVFSFQMYDIYIYYVSTVLVVLSLVLLHRLDNSPFGYALDAIGQDRTRARFIGIPVERYLVVAFIISGLYGGLAGSLFAILYEQVTPSILYFLQSGTILYMAIIGGFEALGGPLLGGLVLKLVQNQARSMTDYYALVTGVIIVITVFGFPKGILGTIRDDRVRTAVSDFRRDPTVVREWLSPTRLSRAVGNAVGRVTRYVGGGS